MDERKWDKLKVEISDEVKNYLLHQGLTTEKIDVLKKVLAQDPRPHYQTNSSKVYGMPYEGIDVHFRVVDGVLVVEK